MTLTTLTYNGLEKSLADWAISACRREVNNQASDHLAFDLLALADQPDPFPFGSKVILQINRVPSALNPEAPWLPPSVNQIPGLAFTGGSIFFVGWRVDNLRTASPDIELLRYKFAGPWDYFLERLVFQKLFLTWNGSQEIADWRSQVVLGMSLTDLTGPNDTVPGSIATTRLSLSQQIREIVNYCINQTTAQFGSPQFQFDALTMSGGLYPLSSTPGTYCKIPDYVPGLGTGSGGNGLALGQTSRPLQAPLESVQDATCAECLRRQLRWIGGVGSPVVWFDYTQSPPALNISTRDQLPSISLPAFASAKNLSITRRDDLVPSAVCLKFRLATTAGGVTTVQVFDDIACAAGCTNEATGVTDPSLLPYRTQFGAQVQTLDFEGPQSTSQSASISCVALDLGDPFTDTTAKTCWQALYPDFKPCSNLKLVSGTLSVTDPVSGFAVSTSGYGYVLLRGGVASWMSTGSTPASLTKVRVAASFTLTSPEGLVVANKPIVVDAILTNLPSGTYSSGEVESVGEAIPWGLASYIYNIERIPQFQGSFTIQETEISDLCPIGNNLNLIGSLADWNTMQACVQGIAYDFDAGSTDLTFGPAPHLGAQDLVERLRINRPPRALYLIGYNLLND
jgi:hypothetical protein